MNPTDLLRQCINSLHQLQVAMPDAQHVQQINQAMAPLLKIQAELAQASQQPQGPRPSLMATMQGGQ